MRHCGAPVQLDQQPIWRLFPGASGGFALLDRYGPAYLAELGAAGGQATRDRYGLDHFRQLGRASGAARRRRRETEPRTAYRLDGSIARLVPWHPHPESSYYSPRRRRPVVVVVELGAGDE